MLNHSDTQNTIYDITNPTYWDKGSLYQEMDRIYDVCVGCRLCFNLCPSFPSLFNSIDNAGSRKRDIAEAEGHHPDLHVGWGRCGVEIWTHDINGLAESDFFLAAKVNRAHNQRVQSSGSNKGE